MGIRLAPGLKFCPTDQELIKFYLRYKLVGKTLLPPDFNSYLTEKILYGKTADEPSKLFAGRSEEYLYFFTQVNKKFVHGNGNHMDRIAGNGSWKIQKTATEVFDLDKKTLIGYRRNLTFTAKNKKEEEQNKPEKISYIMHEFTPLKYPPSSSSSSQNHQAAAEYWTACKIRKMVTKNKNYKPPPSSSVLSSMPIQQGHKRARTSSHDELMLQQSTTSLSTKAVAMPSYQQEQKLLHPCAHESLQTSTYYDNISQTDSSVAYQLADTYTPTVAMMSSMIPDEVVHNLPEYSQPHQSDYFPADQPNHDDEDAYDERLLFSVDELLADEDEQESEDDLYPLNMGMNFTAGMLLANNEDTNMLPNSTM